MKTPSFHGEPRARLLLVIAPLLFLLAACGGVVYRPPSALLFPFSPPPAVNNPISVSDLEGTNLGDYPGFPLIDVHTHTFNALYLPVMNIARGRTMDAIGDWTVTDDIVRVLARAVIGKTLENQENRVLVRIAYATIREDNPRFANLLGITSRQVHRAIEAGFLPVKGETIPADSAMDAILQNDQNWKEFSELAFGVRRAAPAAAGAKRMSSEIRQIAAFLAVLTSGDREIREMLRETFPLNDGLFVSHTMDMGPTYAETPRRVSFWDFFTQQLPRVRELDQDPVSAAMFIHFVAFSPYRVTGTIPPSGWGEAQEFLDIKAAMAAGAWGVKFYPPAGYRASGNDIPSRPILYALLRKQWDSRYLDQSDARLDDINFALFKYCAENNIPVLAHCMTGEFQAASNYGELMAHPAFYRAVLDKLESLPTPLHLRLCLAHAGGPTFWYGIANDDAHKVWGEQVYELCTRYPNVYCDVGCLDNIMDKDQRLVFANQMLALFEKPTAPRAYPFASKIIYGSDWFMPEPAANGVDYLNEYRRVFLTPQLKSHYKDFLCRNALQFLGLAGGDNPRLATLSPAQRDHIRSLVQRARADDVGQ